MDWNACSLHDLHFPHRMCLKNLTFVVVILHAPNAGEQNIYLTRICFSFSILPMMCAFVVCKGLNRTHIIIKNVSFFKLQQLPALLQFHRYSLLFYLHRQHIAPNEHNRQEHHKLKTPDRETGKDTFYIWMAKSMRAKSNSAQQSGNGT